MAVVGTESAVVVAVRVGGRGKSSRKRICKSSCEGRGSMSGHAKNWDMLFMNIIWSVGVPESTVLHSPY